MRDPVSACTISASKHVCQFSHTHNATFFAPLSLAGKQSVRSSVFDDACIEGRGMRLPPASMHQNWHASSRDVLCHGSEMTPCVTSAARCRASRPWLRVRNVSHKCSALSRIAHCGSRQTDRWTCLASAFRLTQNARTVKTVMSGATERTKTRWTAC